MGEKIVKNGKQRARECVSRECLLLCSRLLGAMFRCWLGMCAGSPGQDVLTLFGVWLLYSRNKREHRAIVYLARDCLCVLVIHDQPLASYENICALSHS